MPGTFAVVATPDSFSNLPEYATATAPTDRRPSVQSGIGSPVSSSGRSVTRVDPNTVVLDRFEEVSPSASIPFPIVSPTSRASIPDALRHLSVSTSPQEASTSSLSATTTRASGPDGNLVLHFRKHIAPRLIQPIAEPPAQGAFTPGSALDVFDTEATRFRPVSKASMSIIVLR